MTEAEYINSRWRDLPPRRLLRRISRRGFTASLLGGLATAAVERLADLPRVSAAGADFTIAIIPDPQFLAVSCPDGSGSYYASMMQWIVNNRNITLSSSAPPFNANIRAVVGVGDCVNSPGNSVEFPNAQAAWSILDANRIPFITPPGNHDYSDSPSSRSALGAQFATGYFSAGQRSMVYGSGIDMGGGDTASWVGSFDSTGANTAVKMVISGVPMLILAMDFFAGNAAWSWAHETMVAHRECECYITTHAWLTNTGTQYQRNDGYGPNFYSMAEAPYSNSASEAWNVLGVSGWPNLCGIFCGHDLMGTQNADPTGTARPPWYWQQVPVESDSHRRQTVQQIYANAQQLDHDCSTSVSTSTGSGQVASVMLLSRRPALGLLEARMISTRTGDWFGPRPANFPAESSWSASETLLFSAPFSGLRDRRR